MRAEGPDGGEGGVMALGGADFRPERTGNRPERTNFRSERADSRPERADFRPERADFRPERADFRPERAWGGGQMNERTNKRTKVPCVLQDFVPFGAAAQKATETDDCG